MNSSQSVLILNHNTIHTQNNNLKIKIKLNKPKSQLSDININNFEQYISYTKVDINDIKKTLRPDVKLNYLDKNEALDVSRLNTNNLTNTTRYPDPNNARKLYCKELKLLSNNLPNMLTYIDAYAQIFPDKYDYQEMKFNIYQQHLYRNYN